MRILAILCAVALSGCSTLSPYLQRAADAEDEARKGAEFTMCKAISIGAWVRAYGASSDKANAWKAICAPDLTQLPVPQK